MSSKHYTNMLRYKVAFDVFEGNFIRVVLYSLSWLLKLTSYAIINLAVKKKNLVKVSCYFIYCSQKIHMVTMNSVGLDLIPSSHRTLFQVSEISLITKWLTGILLSLLIYDFCEIYHLGGKANIKEFTPRMQKPDDADLSQIAPLSLSSEAKIPVSATEVQVSSIPNFLDQRQTP